MRFFVFVFMLLCGPGVSFILAQSSMSFLAKDGLEVNADLYMKNDSLPFIILCHQEGASRGEFNEIAKKLLNLNYNCLAIDLRHGDKINYTPNITAERAAKWNYSQQAIDAKQDINAAIDYIYRKYGKSVILLGSSYSASLALLIASESYKVKAVIAFSPGEHFSYHPDVAGKLVEIDIPVFITGGSNEAKYLYDFAGNIPNQYCTTYFPESLTLVHGAKALWDEEPNSKNYWFELLIFFKSLKTK